MWNQSTLDSLAYRHSTYVGMHYGRTHQNMNVLLMVVQYGKYFSTSLHSSVVVLDLHQYIIYMSDASCCE